MKTGGSKRWLAAAGALALALGLAAGPSSAKELTRSDFEGWSGSLERRGGREVKDQAGAPGWRAEKGGDSDELQGVLVLDAVQAGLRPEAGTLDFVLERGNQKSVEALFTLVDANGQNLFALEIYWNGFKFGNQPELVAEGWQNYLPRNPGGYGDMWVPSIPFGTTVSKGEEFRLTVTWGPGGDALYLNGKKLKARVREGFSFGRLIGRTAQVFIGTEPNYMPPKYNSNLTSTLKDFRVLDVATLDRGGQVRQPEIRTLEHNSRLVAGFSGKLAANDSLKVSVTGSAGAAGTFDIAHYPDINGTIDVDWRGWGVYLEEKTFFKEGEIDLRDVEGYRVYARKAPFTTVAAGMEPAAELEATEQRHTLEDLDPDTPYYVGVFAVLDSGALRTVLAPRAWMPLTEGEPGSYEGEYAVTYADRLPRAIVVARLGAGALVAETVDDKPLAFDPSLKLAVTTDPKVLPADEKSTAKVTVTVTDVNGNAVAGHRVGFMLMTTSQYTGVVGGGAFTEQVGGSLSETRWASTDLFGRVSTKYVAGFAAKTAVVVARDLESNDTGAGWVRTFIQSTAQLELTPVEQLAAMAEGYRIDVTSSDEWLTADGKSQARITAKVTLGGKPVEGHKVSFSVGGTGSIRVARDTTDGRGEARAVYTAGKKIGVVLVTATDVTAGISGSVRIELRSDAPAKINIKIKPDSLPADGRSRADLLVQVTDVNDNPNENTEVEYAITEGGGRLRDDKGLTDRRGEHSVEYTAGRTAGRVSIEITVRSTVPNDEELTAARDLALAVKDNKFF